MDDGALVDTLRDFERRLVELENKVNNAVPEIQDLSERVAKLEFHEIPEEQL